MPRVKSAIRTIDKHIWLPETLVAQAELRLMSELEQRVPYGAWQKLIERLLMRWLAELEADLRVGHTVVVPPQVSAPLKENVKGNE